MKHANRSLLAVLSTIVLLASSGIAAAADRPYTEGSVREVSSIRTVDGMFDDYMAWLAGPWQQLMEEQKKAGMIINYQVMLAFPRSPAEPDLYLITEYKNMAALDGLEEKFEPIMEKVLGDRQKANADSAARGKMRTVLGSQLVRELNLK
jgi:hypothetical protein